MAVGCLAAGVLAAADAAPTRKTKSSFLTEKEQAFIRPGLQIDITQASVAADGTATFRFTLADSAGLPLDVDGVTTPGAISVRPVLAFVPAGQQHFRSYFSRMPTSSITGQSAEQGDRDRQGTVEKLGDGEYMWTFSALSMAPDLSATHRVTVWALRDLEEFELGETSAADTMDFVPDGSPVTTTRMIVTDAQCNACHGRLRAHDNRETVGQCITCHNPQSTDPDTGNTVDMPVMIHKIHMGEELPSVQAGQPYQIIGFRNTVHDYSHVVFPADVRNCQVCHIENLDTVPAPLSAEAALLPARSRTKSMAARTAALSDANPSQALTENQHLLNPSRVACGSCHDNVNFATGENHAGLPQPSDNQCNRCHAPQGELDFDLSIRGAHQVERFSSALAGTVFELFGVANTAPGQNPTVTFGIKNDAGAPVEPSAMGRLALVLAGDIGGSADFGRIISESATGATGSGGRFDYTFEAPIPEDATGTWAVGIEGYQSATLLAGTEQERSVRDAGDNVVMYFSTTGGAATERRKVVAQAKCDSCHFDLDLHGSNRNNVEHCVLCHNPATTDERRRPEGTGAPESVNFKDMIHRIHSGAEQIRDYTIYGFGNNPHNYNEVELPQSVANCSACHMDGTELSVPLNAASTVDPRGLFNPATPLVAACTSCHTSLSTAAHAELNVSPTYGDSCDVCHGEGSEFAIDKAHAAAE